MVQDDFSAFSAREGAVFVYADSREDPSVISQLKALGATVSVKMLDVGDYIVSDRCAVERKTRDDFESSIIDGRLFDQAHRICEAYGKAVYIIEGSSFSERIHRKALMAAVSSLMLNQGISVFFTRNAEGTAELIFALASKEQSESKRTILIKKPLKHNDINRQVLYTASALPMIGEKTAEKLLERFGSLQCLFNATEQDLMQVSGVGRQRAREIAKFIRINYKKISQ